MELILEIAESRNRMMKLTRPDVKRMKEAGGLGSQRTWKLKKSGSDSARGALLQDVPEFWWNPNPCQPDERLRAARLKYWQSALTRRGSF
jgi:hypothetical protein